MLTHLRFATFLMMFLTSISAQERKEKVLKDREEVSKDDLWFYNDFSEARAVAEKENKPMLVVLRCIPCEACSQFDKLVMAKNSKARDLFEKFVCVRIVHTNGLDLSLFQFDYDQSFHAIMMHPDGSIYGRYGSRSQRREEKDMQLEGFRASLTGALELHARHDEIKASLSGKIGGKPLVKVPEEFPSLKGRYGSTIDYEGKVVESCIHCHQIRDAERKYYRDRDEKLPEELLYPYPLPDVLGLGLDPKTRGTITTVEKDSIADQAGLKKGDKIQSLSGQPILSTADIQWVLHNTKGEGTLDATIERGKESKEIKLTLGEGWRKGNISWRPTTWELRAWAIGGLFLEDLSEGNRKELKLGKDKLALFAKHVGQYNEHATAKNAGFVDGDIIIEAMGVSKRMSESELIDKALQLEKGTTMKFKVLRKGKQIEMSFPVK